MLADVAFLAQNAEMQPGARGVQLMHAVAHLDPRYGGVSTVVPELVSQLCRLQGYGAELDAFCLPGEQYEPQLDPAAALRFFPLSRRQWITDRALRQELNHAVGRADLIHIHGLWGQSTFATARTAQKHRKPYVVSAHGMLEPWALNQRRTKKRLYAAAVERPNLARAACLHALTEAEARSYRGWNITTPIAVIPNAVEPPHPLSPARFLARFPELAGRRLVLFLGRLHPKKGVDLLLETWAAMHEQWPDAVLVLAGPYDGAGAEVTQGDGTQLIRQGNVAYTGLLHAKDKWSALAAAACFVLPSHSEGLSVAALEAMGAGLPVIVSRQCNLPEVTRAGCGWEIELSAAELGHALESCLAMTPQQRQALGARGAALVHSRFSWEAVTTQMAELYDWVLGGSAPTTFNLYAS